MLVGASHSSDGVTGYVDGTIDDLGLWNDALTAGEVENIYWAGQNEKPTVNASNGGYAFKVTAANSWLKFFNVEYSGPDVGDTSGDGGVIVDDADSVKISEFYFKYNRHAIKVLESDNVEIFAPHIYNCDGALKKGLHVRHLTICILIMDIIIVQVNMVFSILYSTGVIAHQILSS